MFNLRDRKVPRFLFPFLYVQTLSVSAATWCYYGDCCSSSPRSALECMFAPIQRNWINDSIKLTAQNGSRFDGCKDFWVNEELGYQHAICQTVVKEPGEDCSNSQQSYDSSTGLCEDKGQGSSEDCVGNPINPMTGYKFQNEVDLAGRLDIVRSYYQTSDSAHWNFEYQAQLDITNYDSFFLVKVMRDDGAVYNFKGVDPTGYTADGDVSAKLSVLLDGNNNRIGWQLQLTDNSTEIYSTEGLLQEILRQDKSQISIQYIYDTQDPTLISSMLVTDDNSGESLTFHYDNLARVIEIETSYGESVYYSYDTAGRLSEVSYPDDTPLDLSDNPKRIYHYEDTNFPEFMTGVTDEEGRRYSTWSYDTVGRAVDSEHGATGSGIDLVQIDYSYLEDPTDPRVTVTNPLGKDTTYHYVTILGRRKVTQVEGVATPSCDAANQHYTYDSNAYRRTETDWDGKVTEMVRDSRGLVTELREGLAWSAGVGSTLVNNPESRRVSTQWDSNWALPIKRDYSFYDVQSDQYITYRTEDITYNAENRIDQRMLTDLSGHTAPYTAYGRTKTWDYQYEYWDAPANEQLKAIVMDGPRTDVNDVTRLEFSATGLLQRMISETGRITDYTSYDGAGRPLIISDSNGVQTTLTYTPRGWLDTVTLDSGGTSALTDYDYDYTGQVKKVTLPNGVVLNYDYDDAHRLVEISDFDGNYIKYTRDNAGNVDLEEVYDANDIVKRSTDYVYDELSRLRNTLGGTVGADRSENALGYDLNNNLETSQLGGTTAGNNPVTRFYDALNRIKEIEHADGSPTAYKSQYTYDAQDNLTSVTDQGGLVTNYQYDGLGNLMQVDSPDTGLTTYTYDAAGNRTSKTDSRSVVTNYRYDRLNRLLAVEYPANPQQNISYRYDETAGGNYGIGRLTRLQDESGVTLFFYNALGQMVKRLHQIEGVSYEWRFGYDLAGNITSLRYPSGRTVNYIRNQLGQVDRVTTKAWDGALIQTLVDNAQYKPFGPLTQFDYGNGVTHAIDYDMDYRVQGVTSTLSAVQLQAKTLDYYNTNNMKEILDALDANNDQIFTYDQENRLDTATGSYGVLDYDYDGVGNRTQLRLDQDKNQSFEYTENYVYELTSNWLDTLTQTPGGSFDFDYSPTGHLTDDPRSNATLSYNDADRLTAINSNQGTGAYTYNALGQRVIRQATHSSVDHLHYHYGIAGKRLAETANDGSVVREFVFFDDLLIWYFGNELSADTDNDLLDDAWETLHFGGLDQNGSTDADGDGLLDSEEFRLGSDPNTPDIVDRDGDGISVAAGDWDDFDGQSYPGAEEICGDGIDQDNSGSDAPCGDVNGDGLINASDTLLLSQHLLGLRTLSAGSLARADLYPLDGDGQLTVSDLLLQQKIILGQ